MAIGHVNAVDGGAGRAAGVAPAHHAHAPQQAGEARPAEKPENGAPRPQQGDAFHASADLEEEREAEEKKKAEEAKEQQQAEEAKKKELEEKIEQKQAELEQAQQAGDKDKVASLGKEIEGLKQELDNLLNPGAQAAPAPAAGGGGGTPAAGGGGAPAIQGAAPSYGGGGGGGGMAGAPAGSYPPTPSSLGGYHTPSPSVSGPAPKGQITPNGSGQDAVNLAKQYLGRNAIDIKGAMPNFTAAGGQTNNCADFVSSALESTGRLQGHHVNVKELENSLKEQGYTQVPKDQAQPGDVWISGTKGHTELVAEAGGNTLIGSNNDRPGHQVISEHHNPSGGYYYHLATENK